MKQADIPKKFPIPWAANAGVLYVRDVPTESQIGVVDGAASLNDGWVPLNFADKLLGGIPSSGLDDNGIKRQITANLRWLSAGMTPKYDATFATAIGGYPKGAILQRDDELGSWRNVSDDNTSNPNSGGAGWVPMTITSANDPTYTNDSFTPASTSWVNRAVKSVPVGSIVPWVGGFFTNSTNGGFTNVLGNSIAAANAHLNPMGWYVCDGSALFLPGSPIYGVAGRRLPNFTDKRFIMGDVSAGAVGGVNSAVHNHSISHVHSIPHVHTISHVHATGSFKLLIAHMPSHNHTVTTYTGSAQANRLYATDINRSNVVSQTSYSGGNQPHNHGNTGGASPGNSGGSSAANSGAASTGFSGNSSNASSMDNVPKFLATIMIQRAI